MNLFTTEHTIGDGGLSIGTYLSMESIINFKLPRYDPERIPPDALDLTQYTNFYFNIYTLARNIINSYDSVKDKLSIIQHKDFHILLENEISILYMYFSSVPTCNLVVYKPDYSKVIKEYNVGKGILETVPYKMWVFLDTVIKNKLKDKNTKLSRMVYSLKDHKFPKLEGDVLVNTHFPNDMLNKGRLSLLESHTGKHKTGKDLYTKLHSLGDKDMGNIPFLEETLYIFGGGHLIKPMGLGIRRAVYNISVDKNWTYKTTREKVKLDLQNNDSTKDILKDFKRIYL